MDIADSGSGGKVDSLKRASPDFAAMRRLAMRFRGILQSKDTRRLEVWLDDAQQSGIYAVQRFASTLRPHLTAVNYALTETLEEWPDQKTKSTG